MPTYIGFSTIDVCQPRSSTRTGIDGGVGSVTTQPRLGKKFRLTDEQLIIRDFLNAMSIKQGDIVGNPGYGSTIWNYVFEPNTPEVRNTIETEIRRVASLDPRMTINALEIYNESNGVLLEIEMAVQPFNQVIQFGFFLNRFDGSIQQLAQ